MRIYGTLLGGFVICLRRAKISSQAGLSVGLVLDAPRLAYDKMTNVVQTCIRLLAGNFHCIKHDREVYELLRSTRDQTRQKILPVFEGLRSHANRPRESRPHNHFEQCRAFVVGIGGQRYSSIDHIANESA